MAVTAQEVAAELSSKNDKIIIRTAGNHKQLGTIKIFNVGPDTHTIGMGGLGTFTIPACEDGEPVSEPLELWRQFPEGYHLDMNKMAELVIDGREIAESIVGCGKFQTPSSDLRPKGVFIAAGDEPTRKEIDAAKAALRKYDLLLVEQANQFHQAGPNQWENIQTRTHRAAAIRTGNGDLPWVRGAVQMSKCNVCGSTLDPDAAICIGCKSVVPGKEDIVIKARVPGYEHLWTKPKGNEK
jgi:hypothetical protein